MDDQNLSLITLQPARQFPLADLQLRTYLIEAMHPIQILRQNSIINELVFIIFIIKPRPASAMHRGTVSSILATVMVMMAVVLMMCDGCGIVACT
jgi:hypothetical protein